MEKHLTAINSSTGQPYTLGKNEIANAVTRLNAERAVKPGDTITVAFLDTAPDYAITSVETYWAKYFPQIDPNTAHPSWAIRITKEYNEAKLIQTTFQAIPAAQQQAIFDQAIELWRNTYANVNFELITDPAKINQANVRIGLSSAVSQNLAPGALPESGRAKLGDVYLNLSLATSSSGLLGAHALTTMFHEFGHVLGLSHGDDEDQLPVEYGAMQFGVMGARADVRRSFKPVTPLLFDALGLEHMNLLNTNKNETDNYTIAPETGRLIIDSGATDDTLNGSAIDDEIDLRATDFAAGKAYFSSIGMSSPDRYNVAIYEGTAIENAAGGKGHDKLIGNDLANVLDGGEGNDTLEGGAGSDTYKFSGKFGKDSIDESAAMGGDGAGTIQINNIAIAPTGEMVGQYASGNGSLHTFRAKINGQAYTYTLKTSETSGDQLVIAKTGDVANTITLNHVNREALFSANGYLGVKLATTPKVLLRSSLGPNPFEDAAFDPTTVSGSSTVTEHGGKSFALYLNRAAKAGDTITLALSDLKDKFKAILGDVTVPADGAVITLAEGQTQAMFVLVQEGTEVLSDGAAQLSAMYQGQPWSGLAERETAASNWWGIALKDAPLMYALQGGYVLNGATMPSGNWQIQSDGSIPGMTSLSDANDLMMSGFNDESGLYTSLTGAEMDSDGKQHLTYRKTAAVSFWGRGGNDVMSGEQYDDYLDGGDGRDLIWGGAGSDTINGGAGDDIVVTNMAALPAYYMPNPVEPGYVRGPDTVFTYLGDEQNYRGKWFVDTSEDGKSLSISPSIAVKSRVGQHPTNYWPEGATDSDTVDAGDGDDFVLAGRGADYLMGGAGNDRIAGLGGGDVILGGEGKDFIVGDNWSAMQLSVVYDGDRDWGHAAPIPFDDELKSPLLHGDDVIDAGAGDDEVWGDGGNDVIYGGSGADQLVGDALPDDLSPEYHGADKLDGGDGADVMVGGGKDDVLIGGAGNDRLDGDGEGDKLSGAYHGNDDLDGGAGDDTVFGQGGSDTLKGGDGNDHLEGDRDGAALASQFHGADHIDGGAGNDEISGDGGDDILMGGAGNDWIAGEDETQVTSVSALTGNDQIDGGAGDDIIVGGNGNDALLGGADNDQLYGGAGADFLSGGSGSNVLKGGAGDDTYQCVDDGIHAIVDSEGDNIVQGIDGMQASVLSDGTLVFASASKTVSLDKAMYGGFTGRVDAGGNAVAFADYVTSQVRTEMDTVSNTDGALVLGAALADDIRSNGKGSTIQAGRGDDRISTSTSAVRVVVKRGDGTDTVLIEEVPTPGKPLSEKLVLEFGSGISANDIVTEYSAQDNSLVIRYSDLPGDKVLVKYSTLLEVPLLENLPVGRLQFADGSLVDFRYEEATADEDTPFEYVVPGSVFSGLGAGATYVATLADGKPLPAWLQFDPVTRKFSGTPLDADTGRLALRVVGTDAQHASASHAFGLVVRNTNDAPAPGAPLQAQAFTENVAWSYTPPAGSFTDAADAGDTWTFSATLSDGSPLPAWLQVNTKTGRINNIPTHGVATNLSLKITATDSGGAKAHQPLALNVGSALSLVAYDHVIGTPGHDALTGDGLKNILVGGYGDDILDGQGGDDLLLGGNGDQVRNYYQGYGSDTYLFGKGDGRDVILDFSSQLDEVDTLRFKAGVNPSDIVVRREVNALTFFVAGSRDSIRVDDFFVETPGVNRKIEKVQFVDHPAVQWDLAEIKAKALIGSAVSEQILGYESNDLIQGNAGDDTLVGGAGDDRYVFGANDGKDSIAEAEGQGVDQIVFGVDVLPTQVVLIRTREAAVGNTTPPEKLVLRVVGGNTEVWVSGFFEGQPQSGVESIKFADGTIWDRTYILANVTGGSGAVDTFTGTSGDDEFNIDNSADKIVEPVGGGNDTALSSVSYVLPANVENLTLTGVISVNATGNADTNVIRGNSAANTLDWGAGGDDQLYGGQGDDTYKVYADFKQYTQWYEVSSALSAQIHENAGEGVDTLLTNALLAELPEHVEKLTVTSFRTGSIRADSKVKCNTCQPVRSADALQPVTLPPTAA